MESCKLITTLRDMKKKAVKSKAWMFITNSKTLTDAYFHGNVFAFP
jgi:hypothetical protein